MTLSMNLVLGTLRHAIGGGALSTDLGGGLDLANRAGKSMTAMFPWRYLRRSAALDTVATQDHIDLPLNTAEVEDVQGSGPLNFYVQKSTLLEINRWRSSVAEYENPRVFLWAFGTADLASSAPQPRIELYPTPDVSTSSALLAIYRLGWTDLGDDDDVVPIPWYMEELYLELVRETAKGLEGDTMDGTSPTTFDRRDRLRASSTFSDAVDQDVRAQPNLGVPSGGWMDPRGRLHRSLDNGIPFSVS